MEFTTDIQGNKYVSFEDNDDSYLFEVDQIGNKLDDFEILQILSEKKDNQEYSFVAKVRSLKLKKIYSLKKLNLKMVNDYKLRQQIYNVMESLKCIKHPHIIKYYKYFEEDNDLYLVMEYMNNSDIIGYIQGYQILDKQIPEIEIWNLLLQCLSALDYLESLNLGNTGIKLTNIFINNLYNTKISVFRDYNFNRQNVDPNEEIKYLAKYFYLMMTSQFHTIEELNNISFIENLSLQNIENKNYSTELRDFINSMIVYKQNISDLYQKVKKEYSKKFTKNTSIKAILKCLSSYKELNEALRERKNEFENNQHKYFMNYWYLKAIDAINGINENNLEKFTTEFRMALASSFSKLDGNKEIDPLFVLIFLLDKIHRETNQADPTFISENGYTNYNEKTNNTLKNYVFNGEEQDRTNKIQMLSEFVNYFNATMNSIISDIFISFMKTKRICQNCGTGYYSFSNFLYIVFDLSNLDNSQHFDLIEDGFKVNWNIPKTIGTDGPDKIWCESCQTYQVFKEFNRNYTINRKLIIAFIRGKNYKNRSKIIFSENMNLKNYVEPTINTPTNFYLVGSVNRKIENEVEEYVSYYKDSNTKKWLSKGLNYIQKNDNEQIIMLFYNSEDN